MNLKSALYGMQAVLPHFTRGRGHIINVSSLLARLPLAPFRSAYSASKHALAALTASLRMELRAAVTRTSMSRASTRGSSRPSSASTLSTAGSDSRKMPGAQTAEEVAEVIASVIEHPRADVYTRPGAQQMVSAYFGAQDMGLAELQPPFFSPGDPK